MGKWNDSIAFDLLYILFNLMWDFLKEVNLWADPRRGVRGEGNGLPLKTFCFCRLISSSFPLIYNRTTLWKSRFLGPIPIPGVKGECKGNSSGSLGNIGSEVLGDTIASKVYS